MQTKNYLFSLPISHVHYYENFRQTVQGLQFAASRHRLSVRKGLTDTCNTPPPPHHLTPFSLCALIDGNPFLKPCGVSNFEGAYEIFLKSVSGFRLASWSVGKRTFSLSLCERSRSGLVAILAA